MADNLTNIQERARIVAEKAAARKKMAAGRQPSETEDGPRLTDEQFSTMVASQSWINLLRPAIQSVWDRESQQASLVLGREIAQRLVNFQAANVFDDEDRAALEESRLDLASIDVKLADVSSGIRRAHGRLADVLDEIEKEGANSLAVAASEDLPENFRRRLNSFLVRRNERKNVPPQVGRRGRPRHGQGSSRREAPPPSGQTAAGANVWRFAPDDSGASSPEVNAKVVAEINNLPDG